LASVMRRLVMTGFSASSALSDGQGGAIQIETSEGPLELRFTFEDAERLIAGLHEARAKIQRGRTRSGEAPLAEKPLVGKRWETAIDPVNQVAVLRAHFEDRTTQDMRIPRGEIAHIAQFLTHALKRMEPGADMRQ
jgi:hypothetical protein